MMRMILGFGGLTLLWVFCTPLGAQPKEPTLAKGRWTEEIIGLGVTVDAAKKNALQAATKTVSELMEKHKLQSFVITEDYVAQHLLTNPGVADKDEEILPDRAPFKKWKMTLRTDTNWWKDIVRHDLDAQRKLRGEDRQTLASRITIGLAILLLAGFGYVRLDDYTQRRYTAWLRLAGVGVLSTVAAGWWVIFQGGW